MFFAALRVNCGELINKLYLRALMKKWILSMFVLVLLCTQASAQQPIAYTSADIYLQLKKLNVLGSVLYVAAHPDDENTRLLAYLAKEKQYRTGYLSITRGDGGQNLIGDEQGVELGMIRTQELLAARRIDGAEQFFTRAYDFGYSKTAEETMRIWDKEKILGDVVWVIRKFQPDVIITRFPGDSRAGHGHHTASALLANEAFVAAADPNRYPEQLKLGVKAWQAKRILWNSFNFGGNNTTSPDQFKVDVGNYNNLLGKGYGEIASESRSQHKSQGFGVARQRGQQFEFFATTGGDAPQNDLFDNINTGWQRAAGAASIEEEVNKIVSSYSFENPQQSVTALVRLYQSLQALPASYWISKKKQEVQQLIENCSGLFTEAVASQQYGVQGDTLRVNFIFNNRNGVSATVKSVSLFNADAVIDEAHQQAGTKLTFNTKNAHHPLKDSVLQKGLAKNQNIVVPYSFALPHDAPVSQPYWLQKELKGGYFNVQDPLLIGKPDIISSYTAQFVVTIEGEDFTIKRPVQYKYTDPVKGEQYQPLVIMPKVVVSVNPSIVLSNVKPVADQLVTVRYASHFAGEDVPATLSFLNGKATDVFVKKPIDFSKGSSGSFTYPLNSIYHAGQQKNIDPSLFIEQGGKSQRFNLYHKEISYDHIPSIHYFYPGNIKVVDQEVKTAGKKIGYIPGAGDRVAESLELMGFEVIRMQENDINSANLKQFGAVITGIRAYNVHDFLSSKYNDLMTYVKNGGNLIVQYNTNNQIGPVRARISPYPLTITRARITDENSPVVFTVPSHPVLNHPNKLSPADFEGWVQERSIYHAETTDSNYISPIAMNDPGEALTGGGLVIAKHGKGNFVYTGLALFRQLPAGVSGAYRLLANLVALPKNNNTTLTSSKPVTK